MTVLCSRITPVTKNVSSIVDPDKLASQSFQALWKRIRPQVVYVVNFDTEELIQKSIDALNRKLRVSKLFFKVETGSLEEIKSKESLLNATSFSKSHSNTYDVSKRAKTSQSVKYDLIGKLVEETGLTRKAVRRHPDRHRENLFFSSSKKIQRSSS